MEIDKSILEEAVQVFGREKQTSIILEECLELGLSITRYRREDNQVNMDNLIDELADVAIVAEYGPILFDKAAIQERIDYKLARLKKRIEEKKERIDYYKRNRHPDHPKFK